MDIVISSPDGMADRWSSDDIPRLALEALAAEGARSGHLTAVDLRQLLRLDADADVGPFLDRFGIARDTAREASADSTVRADARMTALRKALIAGEESGPATEFDLEAFLARKHAARS
jgi:hypothetical protein